MAYTGISDELTDNVGATITNDGWQTTKRTWAIRGVTSTNGTADVVQQAYTDFVTAKTLPIGTVHPNVSALKVISYDISIVPDTQNDFFITANYGSSYSLNLPETKPVVPTETGVYWFNFSQKLKTVVSDKKPDGTLLTVSHTIDGGPVQSVCTYSRQVPMAAMEIREKRNSSPKSVAMSLVGKINNAAWGGGNAKTWLCEGITATTSDGNYWDTGYSFIYDDDMFEITVYLKHPDTGEMVFGLVDGTGKHTFSTYATADFSVLNYLFT